MRSYTEVKWSPPGETDGNEGPSKNAILALQCVQAAANQFDSNFKLRNPEREALIPLVGTDEIVSGIDKIRSSGFYTEYELKAIRIIMDLTPGDFGSTTEEARRKLSERCQEGRYYAIKYLQSGLIDSDHGPTAACDMIIETKILMNLAPHPNIAQVYGVNIEGIDSFLESGRKSFFFITDLITETLSQRLESWKQDICYVGEDLDDKKKEGQRLEIALDVAMALVYLHDRFLVFNIRPDKVGFDGRYGRIKLCNFSQARQDGRTEHATSITKSDDIKTLAYTAPEMLCRAPATVSSDVYAFGIMLWEILSLTKPFEGYDRSTHFEDVVKCSQRPTIIPNWPKAICDLIQECWHPHRRPTMKVVHETLETTLLFADDPDCVHPTLICRTASSQSAEEPRQRPSSSGMTVEALRRALSQRDLHDSNTKQNIRSSCRQQRSQSTGRPRSKSKSPGRRSTTPSGLERPRSTTTGYDNTRSKSPSVRGMQRSNSSLGHARTRSKSPAPQAAQVRIRVREGRESESRKLQSQISSHNSEAATDQNVQMQPVSRTYRPTMDRTSPASESALRQLKRSKSFTMEHGRGALGRVDSKRSLRKGVGDEKSIKSEGTTPTHTDVSSSIESSPIPPGYPKRTRRTSRHRSASSEECEISRNALLASTESKSSPIANLKKASTTEVEGWASFEDVTRNIVRRNNITRPILTRRKSSSTPERQLSPLRRTPSRSKLHSGHAPSTPTTRSPSSVKTPSPTTSFNSSLSGNQFGSPRRPSRRQSRNTMDILKANGASTGTPDGDSSPKMDLAEALKAFSASFTEQGFDNIPAPSPTVPVKTRTMQKSASLRQVATVSPLVSPDDRRSTRLERTSSFLEGMRRLRSPKGGVSHPPVTRGPGWSPRSRSMSFQ